MYTQVRRCTQACLWAAQGLLQSLRAGTHPARNRRGACRPALSWCPGWAGSPSHSCAQSAGKLAAPTQTAAGRELSTARPASAQKINAPVMDLVHHTSIGCSQRGRTSNCCLSYKLRGETMATHAAVQSQVLDICTSTCAPCIVISYHCSCLSGSYNISTAVRQ